MQRCCTGGAPWLSRASDSCQGSTGNATPVDSESSKPPFPPRNAPGFEFQNLQNLVCVWIARQSELRLSVLFCCHPVLLTVKLYFLFQQVTRTLPSCRERGEHQLKGKRGMLNPQTPVSHRVPSTVSVWEEMFLQKTYRDSRQNCLVSCQNHDKVPWLLWHRTAVQVVGTAPALGLTPKGADKGDTKCCKCPSNQAGQQRAAMPTRHCEGSTRAPFPGDCTN